MLQKEFKKRKILPKEIQKTPGRRPGEAKDPIFTRFNESSWKTNFDGNRYLRVYQAINDPLVNNDQFHIGAESNVLATGREIGLYTIKKGLRLLKIEF